ncbi:hydrogenase maturation protease [Alienimonas sp. DA493]|uniref:hydrogenase maturation protease n=1 Tax=Alienimonas sp. DA493 TaxID=3373605 RepID=UPI0037545DC7
MGGTLAIGLGSAHGDDRAGWLLVERLAERVPGLAVQQARHPLNLLDWLDGVERLILCDAAEPAGRPGRVRRFVWPAPELAERRTRDTHGVSLPAVLALAAEMQTLPAQVEIWTVEASRCEPTADPSPPVVAAVAAAAERIRRSLLPAG